MTLNFDESSVGGAASPASGGISTLDNPFTYHGLTFSTPPLGNIYLVNQDRILASGYPDAGSVSSSPNNLDAQLISFSAQEDIITISTGSTGAIMVISLFVSQPGAAGQSITTSGTLAGADVPGCGGTFTPADHVGIAVNLSNCIADTFVLAGNTAGPSSASHTVGIDTLVACAATTINALTALP